MRNKWLLVIFILTACNSGQPEKNKDAIDSTHSKDSLNKDLTTETPGDPVAHTFWDSISMQLKISDDQMAKYTILDSFDYKISRIYAEHYPREYTDRWGIYGDSLYGNHNFKIAILRYSDGNCLRKYLLVFDPAGKHNLSYTMIEEGCDRDGEDSPYSSQEYKILTDSTFETIETSDPGDADTTDRNITTEITRWKITNRGIVDSIRGKTRHREPKD